MKRIIGFFVVMVSFAAFAEPTKAPSNSVQVIWPYYAQGVWAFDDESKGLVREPFVGAINTMIDSLVTNIPDARVGFRLLFSAGFIPQYDAKLQWARSEPSAGDWYYCEKFKTEGWLCPSLLKYFAAPPKEIYVKVEPLPHPRTTPPPQIGKKSAQTQNAEQGCWLNTKSGIRHNRSCRWFGNTTSGQPCGPDEGRACKQCGG